MTQRRVDRSLLLPGMIVAITVMTRASSSFAGPAIAVEPPSTPSAVLTRLFTFVPKMAQQEMDRRSRVPVAQPWRLAAKKLGDIDLPFNIVGAALSDLDADGFAELVVASDHAVHVVSLLPSRRPMILSAFALTGALVAQRQAIGVVRTMHDSSAARVWVQSSVHVGATVVSHDGKQLVAQEREVAGMWFCDDVKMVVAQGSNVAVADETFSINGFTGYQAACSQLLVDRFGYQLSVQSALSTDDTLTVSGRSECGSCPAMPAWVIAKSGYAFSVLDGNRDGVLDIVTTSASGPSQKDTLTIATQSGALLFRKQFGRGIVAVTTNQQQIVVLVRSQSEASQRFEIWRVQ
jgi:hypothetical protein